MQIYDSTKSIIENLYLLSGPIIALISVIGLYNIYLLKRNMETSTKRDAARHSIQQTDFFCNTIISLYDEYMSLCKEAGIKGIPVEISNEKANIDSFKKEKGETLYLDEYNKRKHLEEKYRVLLNKIELVALSFYRGVALEQMGYEVIGHVFCNVVNELSFELTTQRTNEDDSTYGHSISLFRIWEDKRKVEELKLQKNRSNLKLKKIKPITIKPIE